MGKRKLPFTPKQRREWVQRRTRRGRRQGQEEEVVEGQDEGQAQQPRPLRQGHLRQAHEGGADLQAYHALDRLREDEGPRVAGEEGPERASDEGADPAGGEAPLAADLHEGDQGRGRRGGGQEGGEGRGKEEVNRSSISLVQYP